MFATALYVLTGLLLFISFRKDRKKTIQGLRKSWKAFENILPLFLSIIIIIGLGLALLSPQVISKWIGEKSGWLGIAAAAFIGSVTLIPGWITFPLAAVLLKSGAGFIQITVFVSTSMMVGVVTMPMEIRYLGRKVAVFRNTLALVFSFIVSLIMWEVLK
jgi:uncharacterized membrane protein YraQ (UPF0718 family)